MIGSTSSRSPHGPRTTTKPSGTPVRQQVRRPCSSSATAVTSVTIGEKPTPVKASSMGIPIIPATIGKTGCSTSKTATRTGCVTLSVSTTRGRRNRWSDMTRLLLHPELKFQAILPTENGSLFLAPVSETMTNQKVIPAYLLPHSSSEFEWLGTVNPSIGEVSPPSDGVQPERLSHLPKRFEHDGDSKIRLVLCQRSFRFGQSDGSTNQRGHGKELDGLERQYAVQDHKRWPHHRSGGPRRTGRGHLGRRSSCPPTLPIRRATKSRFRTVGAGR